MTLAEPLARALDIYSWSEEARTDDANAILAALRADPAVLAAVAEALHEIDDFCEHGGYGPNGEPPDWKQCEHRAARLLDRLIGRAALEEKP